MNNLEISIIHFLLIYVLLLFILLIMKKCKIDQTKLLVIASMKMTLQLILAGFILEYIFKTSNPLFTLVYLSVMTVFTIYRILSKNKWLNKKFKIITTLSVCFSSLFVIVYFIILVAKKDLLDPQYVIPIGGMVLGNTMTALTLGLKTFCESLNGQQSKINALQCAGASADHILLPFVKQALETAILPTLNSMIGMGIVHLPGMMTGQILAGAVPFTAILYQIAIMIAICTTNALSCFGALYFGYQTMYDKQTQIIHFHLIENES